MAIRQSEQRKTDAEGLRKRIAQLNGELNNMSHMTRLLTNEDFCWYRDMWLRRMPARRESEEKAKDIFLYQPCGVDETMKLKQSIMAIKAYSDALTDFMEGPAREVARLRKMQDEELPKLQDQLLKIEEASKHD